MWILEDPEGTAFALVGYLLAFGVSRKTKRA